MIPERLRFLRQEAGLSKKELVERLPFNYSTYANYESGIREPNSDVLREVAKFYNVSIDYIVGHSDDRQSFSPRFRKIQAGFAVTDNLAAVDGTALTMQEQAHIKLYRKLDEHGRGLVDSVMQMALNKIPRTPLMHGKKAPVLRVFNQRASAGLGNYLGDYSDQDYEELELGAGTGADFGVRITGDSMAPKILDGDIVYVKNTPHIDPNLIGIFIYEGESYCKRLKIDRPNGAIYLESLNPAYAPILIEQPGQLRTVGEVIGVAEKGVNV